MKKLTSTAVVTLAIAMTTAPAIAQDADWTGGYAGIAFVGGELSVADNDFDLDRKPSLHAGYLYDLGAYVVGAEIERVATSYDFGVGSSDLTYTRAKVTAGYDAGTFMPYAMAGYGQLRGFETDLAPLREDGSLFWGLGASYQLNEAFRASLEYSNQVIKEYDDLPDDFTTTQVALRISYGF